MYSANEARSLTDTFMPRLHSSTADLLQVIERIDEADASVHNR